MQPATIDGFGPVSLVLIVLYCIGRRVYLHVQTRRFDRWAKETEKRQSDARLLALCAGDPQLLELCGFEEKAR